MPLCDGKPRRYESHWKDLSHGGPVFKVRFTPEYFESYSAYLEVISLYRKRSWSCEFTGRSNLTFEEALISEREAIRKAKPLPKEIVPKILSLVQFSRDDVDSLISRVSAVCKNYFFAGCHVSIEVDGRRTAAVVKGIQCMGGKVGSLKRKHDSGNDGFVSGDDILECEFVVTRKPVQKQRVERKACNVSHHGNLMRENLHAFIRASAVRVDTGSDRWWQVKPQIAEQLGISSVLPVDLEASRVRYVRQKHKRLRLSHGDLHKDHKAQRRPVPGRLGDDLVIAHSESLPDPRGQTTLPLSPRGMAISELVYVWSFFRFFSKPLQLYPFSLGDCSFALEAKYATELLREMHISCCLAILDHMYTYDIDVNSDNWWQRVRTIVLKLDVKGGHCRRLCERPSLERLDSYLLLPHEDKLALLCFLVDRAVDSNLIRNAVERKIETGDEIRKELRGLEAEDRNRRSEVLALIRKCDAKISFVEHKSNVFQEAEDTLESEERAHLKGIMTSKVSTAKFLNQVTRERKILKQNLAEMDGCRRERNEKARKLLLQNAPRLQELGQDRFFRRYWFFEGAGGFLFREGAPFCRIHALSHSHGTSENSRAPEDGEMSDEDCPVSAEHIADPERIVGGLVDRCRPRLHDLRLRTADEEHVHVINDQIAQGDWEAFSTDEAIEEVLNWLDDRGMRENDLKRRLNEILPEIGAEIRHRVGSENESILRHSSRLARERVYGSSYKFLYKNKWRME